MKQITSKQLAYLIQKTHINAMKVILRAKRKSGEKVKESDWEFMTEVTADVDVVSKEVGFDVGMAMDDLYNNALTRPAFKKWILHDYPMKKLNAKEPPKKVSLPAGLKSLLNPDVVDEVEKYWNDHFGDYKNPEWDEKKQEEINIKFKP